jgi:hypothetical protein
MLEKCVSTKKPDLLGKSGWEKWIANRNYQVCVRE